MAWRGVRGEGEGEVNKEMCVCVDAPLRKERGGSPNSRGREDERDYQTHRQKAQIKAQAIGCRSLGLVNNADTGKHTNVHAPKGSKGIPLSSSGECKIKKVPSGAGSEQNIAEVVQHIH